VLIFQIDTSNFKNIIIHSNMRMAFLAKILPIDMYQFDWHLKDLYSKRSKV